MCWELISKPQFSVNFEYFISGSIMWCDNNFTNLRKEMTKIRTVFVVLWYFITQISELEAECCGKGFEIDSCCGGCYPYKQTICYDGTIKVGSYCGIGECNLFGCDCSGGCRKNIGGYHTGIAKIMFAKRYDVRSTCLD